MEIIPSTSTRPRRTGRLALGVLAAVLVLSGILGAVPVVLGKERVAMADHAMGAALPRGSYVLVEHVPSHELELGDVVGFRDPVGDGWVIRRVSRMQGGWVELTGDVAGTEATTLRAVQVRRVDTHVPGAGYPMLVLPAWPAPYLILAAFGAAILAGLRLTDRGRDRSRVLAPLLLGSQQPRARPLGAALDVPVPRSQSSSRTSADEAPGAIAKVAEVSPATTA